MVHMVAVVVVSQLFAHRHPRQVNSSIVAVFRPLLSVVLFALSFEIATTSVYQQLQNQSIRTSNAHSVPLSLIRWRHKYCISSWFGVHSLDFLCIQAVD